MKVYDEKLNSPSFSLRITYLLSSIWPFKVPLLVYSVIFGTGIDTALFFEGLMEVDSVFCACGIDPALFLMSLEEVFSVLCATGIDYAF